MPVLFLYLHFFHFRKPSLSKRLSELAQRVDFTDEEDYGKEEEVKGPPAKKPTRRWPWEFCHSKLKQVHQTEFILS